jgi:glycine cleavage system H protein
MDGFTYHNIFDTKGIEYIVIICFFLILIPFWIGLNKTSFKKAIDVLATKILRIPQGLFFSKNHTWAFLEKTGSAKVGLDDFMQRATGNVNFNYMKSTNENIKKGDVIAEIIQNGKTLKVLSPISGTILKTNENLNDEPGKFNEDPYELGWLYSMKPNSWVEDTKSYLLAENAEEWAKNELSRFKDFVVTSASNIHGKEATVALQDGGEIREHILDEMPSEVWEDFQKEFLNH